MAGALLRCQKRESERERETPLPPYATKLLSRSPKKCIFRPLVPYRGDTILRMSRNGSLQVAGGGGHAISRATDLSRPPRGSRDLICTRKGLNINFLEAS